MKPKVGLEVHVHVATRSKLFCACSADFLEAQPLVNVCPVCMAQPGAKPAAPNREAFVAAIRLARATGMRLEARATFLRKHYFYPDSPANYQRTSTPVATGGRLRDVGLTEVHVEENPGAFDLDAGLIDDNRAGVPLLELVTEPDMASADEARAFLNELRLVLDSLGIAVAAAGVKADCNVSLVHDDGSNGPRVEIKNVSGFRNAERAIIAEIDRQREVVRTGGRIERETRGFDEASGRSVRLRSKESEADYRYLVDPDVRPVDVAGLALEVPHEEPPTARRARLAALSGAGEEEVGALLAERGLADAFESLVAQGIPALEAHRFLLRDVRGDLEMRGRTYAASGLTVDDLGALLQGRTEGRLTPHQVTRLLRLALDGGDLASALAEESGQRAGDLDGDARAVVSESAKAVADYRAGKAPALHFLVGALMKRTRGRADIEQARAAILRALDP